jgi:hypothetical protein
MEQELEAARRAVSSVDWSDPDSDWEQAQIRIQRLESTLAKMRGQTYLEMVDFGLKWEPNVSSPYVFGHANKLAIGFRLCPWEPGVWAETRGFSKDNLPKFGLLQLSQTSAWKITSLGDDSRQCHPFYGRGILDYSVQQVGHSQWIDELESQHRSSTHVHRFQPSQEHHYIFWFRDDALEVVTRGWVYQLYSSQDTMTSSAISWLYEGR